MSFIISEPGEILFNNLIMQENFTVNNDIIIAFDYKMECLSSDFGGFTVAFSADSFTEGGDPYKGVGYAPATTHLMREHIKFINSFDGDQVQTFNGDELIAFPKDVEGLIGGWCGVCFQSNGRASNELADESNRLAIRGPHADGCKLKRAIDFNVGNSPDYTGIRIRLFNLGQNISVEKYNTTTKEYEFILENVAVTAPNRLPEDEFTVKVGFIFASVGKTIKLDIKNISYSGTAVVL